MTHFRTELLDALGVNITRLVTDSRLVQTGDTFVAYPGARTDGRQFIGQAIANGANAVIWEAKNFVWDESWLAPHLAVNGLRHQAGAIADHVYSSPSRKLWMVGVTGTNGKTSCSHWIAGALTALGRKSAVLGTLGNGFPGDLQPTLNTTPEAISVHGLLAGYAGQGAQAVAMEVSSHALAQGRVNAVHYDVALLTNLSRDHLDFHGDMHSYASSKRKLFDWASLKYAVLNLDDAFGAELAAVLRDAKVEVVGYGLSDGAMQLAERLGIRMIIGCDLEMGVRGMDMRIRSSWGMAALHSSQIGRFSASNLLGVLAVLLVSDIALSEAAQVLAQQNAVAGRMQRLGSDGKPTVIVDYAHTPDALEKVLQALREISISNGGKLICIFGCGGDRDRGKRPMMGTVASRLADETIVTSDNPRSEDPQSIIKAVVMGMEDGYRVIADRAQAIAYGIACATAQDTVLIAGKGHEDYQEINGVRHPFSDLAIAQNALNAWQEIVRQPLEAMP